MEALDDDPFRWVLIILQQAFSFEVLLSISLLIILVVCSGLISGSEVAFFSIRGKVLSHIKEDRTRSHEAIANLISKPRLLLATILIANNIVNIAIVILSTIISDQVINFGKNPILAFLVDVVAVTFILVLLGEVIPKIYANHLNVKFASFMAIPMIFLRRILNPLAQFLVSFTNVIEKRMGKNGSDVSLEDLKEAIEITADEYSSGEGEKILKGIVTFGNTTVKQIMTSRIDVLSFDVNKPWDEILRDINENRYSRIPVFEETFDKVKGILYIKDLIPYLHNKNGFDWNTILREPYFVPENKKIDDLLKEFQEKKVHMAVVVDEYGGSSGIVTMEDILEEIVGEIHDEFDDDEIYYSKLDGANYVFDGKTSLTDFKRVLNLDESEFEEYKGDVESIGGLVVEVLGRIPNIGEKVEVDHFLFTVESSDKRRVRRVKVTFLQNDKVEESGN